MEEKSFHDENTVTLDTMRLYGIDHVRGGMYSSPHLDATDRAFIKRQLWSSSGQTLCLRCGSATHLQTGCASVKDAFGDTIDTNVMNDQCYSCGESGHFARDCTGSGDESSEESDGEDKSVTCYKCGERGHYANDCT